MHAVVAGCLQTQTDSFREMISKKLTKLLGSMTGLRTPLAGWLWAQLWFFLPAQLRFSLLSERTGTDWRQKILSEANLKPHMFKLLENSVAVEILSSHLPKTENLHRISPGSDIAHLALAQFYDGELDQRSYTKFIDKVLPFANQVLLHRPSSPKECQPEPYWIEKHQKLCHLLFAHGCESFVREKNIWLLS